MKKILFFKKYIKYRHLNTFSKNFKTGMIIAFFKGTA